MTLQPLQVKQLSADGFTWNQYSDRVGTITNELRHFASVTYFAFDSWTDAHDFFKSITDKRLCSRAKVRQSERFTTSHECKIWGMNQTTLEKLIERDRTRKPKSLPLPPLRREWESVRSYDSIAYEAYEAA